MSLTAKQRKFADNYIKSGNATQAYKLAYSAKNMSPTSINSEATKTLRKPNVKAYIDSRLKELSNSKIATAEEILEYLTSVVRGEQVEDVVTNKGIFHDVPVGAKDRLTAAKEILKRYPYDPISKVQLKKIEADIKLIEARTKILDSANDIDNPVLNKMLQEVKDGVINGGSN